MSVVVSERKIKQWFFAALIISLNFGEYLAVAGRSLSQYIALALMLFSIIDIMESYHAYGRLEREKKVVLLLAAFWMCLSVIQGLWVTDYRAWMFGLRTLFINLFICIELCILFRDSHEYMMVLKGVEVSLYLSVAFGILEIITGIHLDDDLSFGNDIRTFFGNPNDYATWIVLCLFGTTLYYARKKRRCLCALAWILAMYIVLHTGSRAALLSLLIAVVFFVIGFMAGYEKNIKGSTRKRIKAFHIIGMAAVAVFLTICLSCVDIVTLANNDVANASSNIIRLKIIRDSAMVICGYLFMGAGAGQTTIYIGINPHNFLLELLGDYGIVVTVILLYMLWKIFVRIFADQKVTDSGIVCFAFAPAFVMVSISSSSILRLRIMWVVLILFYLIAGEEEKECRVRMMREKYGG